MIAKLIRPEIEELISSRNWRDLKEIIIDVPPVDLAELLNDLDNDTALIVFRLLNKNAASEVFSHLSPQIGVQLINRFTSSQVRDIIGGMPPDDRAAFIEELPGTLTQMVMNRLYPIELEEVKVILGYPEFSVGRLMTPKYVRVKKNWTIERSMQHIRKWGTSAETINVIYVVDDNEKLIDDIKLNQLILANTEDTISTLMDEKFIALNVLDDQEEAVKALSKYDRIALPVVDGGGIIVGIVTADDVFDIAEEEATEDMYLMAGMEALDDYYSKSSISEMVQKRVGWLLVLFLGQLLTTTALGAFEDVIASAVFLSLFIPMIISSGGNSGSQAATLIIRAMATDDIHKNEWIFVLKKELFSGLLLGCLVGLSGFTILTFWFFMGGQAFDKTLWLSASTIALSLLFVVLIGNLLGAMLPFLISKMGFDPAVTSAPFVSTLSDVTGILIYFSIATLLLKGILL